MKVLLLGGTGAMGVYVQEFLAERDDCEVFITSRKAKDNKDGVTYIQGDAMNMDFMKKLCSEHWSAIVDFMVYSTEELKRRLDLMLDATDQYIFISSARVYADSKEKITEDSPRLLDVSKDQEYLATDEYALAKAREENILLQNKKRNWTIVRPSLTYSNNRLQLGVYEKENWLYRALKGRPIVFSKDLIDHYYTLSHGKDVAEGIAAIVGKQSAVGEVFHIVQEESFQWKDVLELYLREIEKVTGRRPQVIFTEKCTNLRIKGLKYQVIYGRYFNRFFSNAKIRQYVDTSHWVTPDIGLVECIDEFLQEPHFLRIDWKQEAMIDRAIHGWTPLREIPGIKKKVKYMIYRIVPGSGW